MRLNTLIQSFPSSVVAGAFGFTERSSRSTTTRPVAVDLS